MRTVAVLTLAAASFASQQQTMEGSMQAPQRVRLRFIARSVLSALAIVAVRGFVTPAAAQLTERVSVDSAGTQADLGSSSGAIAMSAGGRPPELSLL